MFSFYNRDLAEPAPAPAGDILSRCFGYHLWATQAILERCALLDDDELALGAPGTFGSILDTCGHLVSADRGYWSRLAGRGPAGDLEDKSIPALLELWRQQRERWTAYLGSAPEFDVELEGSGGVFRTWVRVAQAFHHGNDHRTHIGTVLLHHGLEAPDIDVWAYGQAEGLLREIA
jgi:uncharacterized damage-inducible protein DinB